VKSSEVEVFRGDVLRDDFLQGDVFGVEASEVMTIKTTSSEGEFFRGDVLLGNLLRGPDF